MLKQASIIFLRIKLPWLWHVFLLIAVFDLLNQIFLGFLHL